MKQINLNKKLWITLGVVFLILTGLLVLSLYFFNISMYLLSSIILMQMINPVVEKIENIGYSKNFALLFIFTCLLLIVVLSLNFLVPSIISEINSFNKDFPSISGRINSSLIQKVSADDKYYYKIIPLQITVGATEIDMWKNQLTLLLRSIITGLFDVLIALLIFIPIITIILVKEGTKIKKSFFALIPNRYFEVTLSILDGVGKTLSRFVYAKGIQTLIVAVISIIGFLMIGLKGAIIIGIIAGILNIIPYFGPLISLIPAFVIGYLFNDLKTAVLALAVIGIAQLVDNAITQPVILPKIMDYHPLTVVLLTLIGAKLMGPVGMIIAIPVYAIFKVTFVKLYRGLDIIYTREYYTRK